MFMVVSYGEDQSSDREAPAHRGSTMDQRRAKVVAKGEEQRKHRIPANRFFAPWHVWGLLMIVTETTEWARIQELGEG